MDGCMKQPSEMAEYYGEHDFQDEMNAMIQSMNRMIALGRAYSQILYQDVEWKDAGGTLWKLEEMTPSHVSNLIKWLERRASMMKRCYYMYLEWDCYSMPHGDAATDAIEGMMMKLEDMSVHEWIMDTTLVRRLTKLEAMYERR